MATRAKALPTMTRRTPIRARSASVSFVSDRRCQPKQIDSEKGYERCQVKDPFQSESHQGRHWGCGVHVVRVSPPGVADGKNGRGRGSQRSGGDRLASAAKETA